MWTTSSFTNVSSGPFARCVEVTCCRDFLKQVWWRRYQVDIRYDFVTTKFPVYDIQFKWWTISEKLDGPFAVYRLVKPDRKVSIAQRLGYKRGDV